MDIVLSCTSQTFCRIFCQKAVEALQVRSESRHTVPGIRGAQLQPSKIHHGMRMAIELESN